jgi:uncharacterized RDD family membrane protein YckC
MTESRMRTETRVHDDETTRLEPTGGATRVATDHPGTDWQEAVRPPRRDRVRWGPVWAGLVVAVPTFLLLQLATLALGWWDVGSGGGNNADWLSGVNGLIALFLGGLTAAATAIWRGISDGLLHGILVWALTVVTLVVLTLFGGGALLGSLAGVVTDIAGIQQADIPDVATSDAAQVARSGASWAVLGLGLSVAAAALGGIIGAKMWPAREDVEVEHRDGHAIS